MKNIQVFSFRYKTHGTCILIWSIIIPCSKNKIESTNFFYSMELKFALYNSEQDLYRYPHISNNIEELDFSVEIHKIADSLISF